MAALRAQMPPDEPYHPLRLAVLVGLVAVVGLVGLLVAVQVAVEHRSSHATTRRTGRGLRCTARCAQQQLLLLYHVYLWYVWTTTRRVLSLF